MIRTSAWFLVFLFLTAGCLDEPDCFHLNNNFIGISFKKLEDGSADTVVLSQVRTLEPPLLFYADTSVSKLVLPLNYFTDETTFIFETGENTHWLRLGYISQAQFVSEDCGEKFVLSAMRVLEHSFDSVRVISDVPSSEGGTTQIEIFQ